MSSAAAPNAAAIAGGTPAKNAITTAVTTMTGFVSRETSSGGSGIVSFISAVGCWFRMCIQCSTSQSSNSPITATGPRWSRKSR